jgi:hypothetical protein
MTTKTILGPFEVDALRFVAKNQGWHTYSDDRLTLKVINRLDQLGLIQHDRDLRMFAGLNQPG